MRPPQRWHPIHPGPTVCSSKRNCHRIGTSPATVIVLEKLNIWWTDFNVVYRKERSGLVNSNSSGGNGGGGVSDGGGAGGSSSGSGGEMVVGLLGGDKDDSLALWSAAAVDSAPTPAAAAPVPAAQGSHASLTSSGYNSLNKKAKGEGQLTPLIRKQRVRDN